MPLPLVPIAIGLPVLGLWGVVARVVGQDWPKLRNMFFFPLGGTQRPHHALQRQRVLRRLNGSQVRLVTNDQRTVSAVWAEPPESCRAGAGVILLGANAMVLDDMLEYAEWYLDRLRVPVLLVNLWGYPDPAVTQHHGHGHGNGSGSSRTGGGDGQGSLASEGILPAKLHLNGRGPPPDDGVGVSGNGLARLADASGGAGAAAAGIAELGGGVGAGAGGHAAVGTLVPTELSAYLDGEAAFAHMRSVRGVPPEGILIHGVSIGGAIAAAIAANHPGVRVTLDQPFDTLKEVTRNMTHQVVDGLLSKYLASKRLAWAVPVAQLCVVPPLAGAVSFLLVRMCFKKGLGGDQLGCAPTDLFDNVGKARRIEGHVFVFAASDDEMMHPDAAMRILGARYNPRGADAAGAGDVDAHHAVLPGGHMTFFGDTAEACARYVDNLQRTGFLAVGAQGVAPALE